MPDEQPAHISREREAMILSSIDLGKATLSRALDQRSYHWQESNSLLLGAIQKFETFASSCRTTHADVGGLLDLAKAMFSCYSSTGDENILIGGINLCRESLFVCPSEHPVRADLHTGLAALLWLRYKSTGEDQLLAEAISIERDILALHPPDHPERASSCTSLARSLHTHYDATGDDQLLTEAIDLGREALALRPSGHPDRSYSCGNLAVSLIARYKRIGDEQLLTEVIDLEREVLALRPAGHPNRSYACGNLAYSLRTRYDSTGDDQLLNEAIDLHREALELRPSGHPDRSNGCANLADSLLTRHFRTGDAQLLTEAIELHREALVLRPSGHPDRSTSCGNLAVSLRTRYTSTGDDQLLTEAIGLEREALALRHPGHLDRSSSCVHLAQSLWMRYNSTGDDQLLIEAIDLHREALALRPPGHLDRSNSCANLASSLRCRYDNTGDVRLLIEVINLQREALGLRPSGHPDRPLSCANLATSLHICYNITGSGQLLNEVMDLYREALALYPPEHPNRSYPCASFADLLRTRYDSTGENHLIDEVHALCIEGAHYSNPNIQWLHVHNLVWLHLQPGSYRDLRLATHHLSQCFINDLDRLSLVVSQGVLSLGLFWEYESEIQVEDHTLLVSVYQRVIRLLPLISNPVVAVSSQLRTLRAWYQLGSDAFINAVLAGQLASGVEDLELVQGLCWSQYLHYKDPQLEEIPIELASQMQKHLDFLKGPSASTDDLLSARETSLTFRDAQHTHVRHIYALLREIRALPGLERFMLGETFDLLRSVASSHPVVLLVGARGHFYALLLTHETDCVLMPLAINEDEIRKISAQSWGKKSHRGPSGSPAETSEVSEDRGLKPRPIPQSPTSRWMRYLWVKIVYPVIDRLGLKTSQNGPRQRLHWYPTGLFTSLPLHAAGIYDGPTNSRVCCADYVVSSYTPTLTTLLRAQSAAKPVGIDTSQIVLAAEKNAHEAHLQIIHGVDDEAANVASAARSTSVKAIQLLSNPVTIAETCAAMKAANIIHLACHGIQDSTNALESGFCLGDGRLTIERLMGLKLDNPFLAFLSACETAKGDEKQPDQVMHLAAAMMFLGYQAVVATMWAITDEDGPKMATWFYEELFARKILNGDAVAYALDTAVRKLRDSGVPLERWAPFIHMGV